MTKKDYELIATTIATRLSELETNYTGTRNTAHNRITELEFLAYDFSIAFKTSNPKFDSDKFVKACGF